MDIDFLLLFNGVEEKGCYSCFRSDRVLNEAKGLKRTSGFDVEKDSAERVMCNDPEWDQTMETGDWTIVTKEKLATYKSKGKLVSKIDKLIQKRKIPGESEEEEGTKPKVPTPVKQVEPDIQEVNIGDKTCVKCKIDFENTAKLRRHVTMFHIYAHRFQCSNCDKGYDTKEGLKKHDEYRHKGKEKRFECDVCGSKFQEKSLTQHKKTQHPPPDAPKYKCKGYGKEWLIKKELEGS